MDENEIDVKIIDGNVVEIIVINPGPPGDWRERWPHEDTQCGGGDCPVHRRDEQSD